LRFLDRLQPLGLLVMRLALGAIMIAYGAQKALGGMSAFVSIVKGFGFPWWMAYVAVVAELGGGTLLVLGLLTRVAALALFVEMCVAIAKVTWPHGLRGPLGYGFPLACAALAFALIFFGGGPIALDAVMRGGGGPSKSK